MKILLKRKIKRFNRSAIVSVYGYFEIIKPENLILNGRLSVNAFCYINASEKIIIGDNVSLSSGSKLITTTLDKNNLESYKHIHSGIEVGNNVQIGANAIVLPGVKIGNNVIVGAGAVVTKNIEDNCIVAGVPAKIIERLCTK
ncbi:acyltransferase [Vibrio parahaemolyticus]|nr:MULTISPECIES: acyltransferase [Vibrio]EHZ2782101.1 acyltransferase [Vibrio parahaemolyticus]EJG1816715.1 acyltransferase [Vibrio parahaemolyticus]MDW2123463.1 acyltransferase [Vibrio sp. 2033]MDW3119879.1 acyltransferase [Vibrio sp. 1974]